MEGPVRNDRPLRVLHLVDSLRVGGKERQVVELLKGLCHLEQVQLMLVTMGQERFYVPEIEGLELPLIYLLRKMRWDPSIFIRLHGILRNFKADIVHTNSDMATFYALPLTKLLRAKLVNGCVRGALPTVGLRGKLRRLLLGLSDARVANSKAGLESVGLREGRKGNYVIYNGFDVQGFRERAGAVNGSEGWNIGSRKVVGMVAEFSDYKDYVTYIKAAQMILQKRNDVSFIAVGGGKNLEACKQLAASAGSGIRFLGERRDVEAIVNAIHVGVLCTYTEGISNSVMEYMAAGKPSIVTDGGGSRELVVDGHTGFLVSPSNPQAVAAKIELLLDSSDLGKQMGRAAKERLLDKFSLEQLVENTMRMYRETLQVSR
jgi:glycosyltransferase involved in cell wall biosynthesis